MRYKKIKTGTFVARPNRFVAQVKTEQGIETVHVKNTGRCKELLVPDCRVVLSVSDNPCRKTSCDLVGVYKNGDRLFNIDSQAPNLAVKEWLECSGEFDLIKPEFCFGSSRIDFFMERKGKKYLLEVKGCTLEKEGVGYFPDAPTLRGVKHLQELASAAKSGYIAAVAFVIQAEGITEVRPNTDTHPLFAKAWEEAEKAGVKILFLPCSVFEDGLTINSGIQALL